MSFSRNTEPTLYFRLERWYRVFIQITLWMKSEKNGLTLLERIDWLCTLFFIFCDKVVYLTSPSFWFIWKKWLNSTVKNWIELLPLSDIGIEHWSSKLRKEFISSSSVLPTSKLRKISFIWFFWLNNASYRLGKKNKTEYINACRFFIQPRIIVHSVDLLLFDSTKQPSRSKLNFKWSPDRFWDIHKLF